MDIYSQAKKTIHIVDDYISIKTLYLLQDIRLNVAVTMFSDNNFNKLHASDYADFQAEFPNITVSFIRTKGLSHDRFIVLDYDTADERAFHCGASSKDAGSRMTAITEFVDEGLKKTLHDKVGEMLSNPRLVLK